MKIKTLYNLANRILIHDELSNIKKHIKQSGLPYLISKSRKSEVIKYIRIKNKNNNNIAELQLVPKNKIECVSLYFNGKLITDSEGIKLVLNYAF
jgi:hypothetical protein